MKKPRKRKGSEYEFYNMFMDAIDWDKVNNIKKDELDAILGKIEKEKEKDKK